MYRISYRASLCPLRDISCYSSPNHILLSGDVSTAMPTRHKGIKTNKKDQDGSSGRDEVGGNQKKQGREHKTELGEGKQLDVDGNRGIIGDEDDDWIIGNEDDDWKWSDGELDDERLQAFFDKRPIT